MVGTAVREFLVKYGLPRGRIIAAASGGTDSTALLLALAELRDDGYELIAAHVNHALRGADSDEDEAFVRDLCATLDVELHIAPGILDERAIRDRGLEAAAREVRYARLAEIRERTGARFIATAHHQDDQAETVLMRLLTGSGIAGLRGVHPVRDDGFIRPLLDVRRADIEAFLRARNVTPRHDRSNDDPRFLRNRVRGVLRELGGVEQLASIAAQATAMWPVVERAIDEAERAHAEVRENETRFAALPDDPWLRGALLQRHIRRLDPHARDHDAQRIASETEALRRAQVTKSLELVREGDALVLRRSTPPFDSPRFEVALTPGAPAHIAELGVTVLVERATAETPHDGARRQLIQLPAGALASFTVRNRQPGDRFHPLGMPGSKKLKDFLIDRRIAADVRDRLPLVVWNGEIVWVAGVEVAERVKVTSPTAGDLYELSIA